MKRKHDVLARFLGVPKPLLEVYTIPQTSLHIYTDNDGQFISFNKRGILFFNLRYFEAWRTSRCASGTSKTIDHNWGLSDDDDVEQGNSGDALTFWHAFPVFLDYVPC